MNIRYFFKYLRSRHNYRVFMNDKIIYESNNKREPYDYYLKKILKIKFEDGFLCLYISENNYLMPNNSKYLYLKDILEVLDSSITTKTFIKEIINGEPIITYMFYSEKENIFKINAPNVFDFSIT